MWGGLLFAVAVVVRLLVARYREHRDVLALARRGRRRAVEHARRRSHRDRGGARIRGSGGGDRTRAMSCSRSTEQPVQTRRLKSSSTSIAAATGTRLSYTLLRLARSRRSRSTLAPAPRGGSMYFVLAAVGLFTLLVGASVRLRRPRRSGDAPLLLAVRRVLRRVQFLVQRSVGSAGLGVLLGRRDRLRAVAATAAAFHPRVSRASPSRAIRRDAASCR